MEVEAYTFGSPFLFPYMTVLFLVDSFGSIEVAELNWGDADHIRAVDPPFDYIIGTDVVSLYNSKHIILLKLSSS